MIALSFIICLGLSMMAEAGIEAWGSACIKISQCHPTRDDFMAWRGSGDTPIRGYYKKISNTVYKKTNDINCKNIDLMNKMWFKKSGSTYYLNPTGRATASNAQYKGCSMKKMGKSSRAKFICNAPGNGPAPTKPMWLNIATAAASNCATKWATTNYADTTVLANPQDYVSPVDEDGFFDDQEEIWDDDFNAVDDDGFDEFEEQPKLASPTFEVEPAENAWTVTIGKWTMLIATLIMANLAVFMTILYCKEKNKANTKYVDQF